MRLVAVLALALIVSPLSAAAGLAASPAKVRLTCKPGKALKPVVAAITATPEIQDAEGARLDVSHAVQGLPAITVPQRPDMDTVPIVWTFDAEAGVYRRPDEALD
jgi:hypothetical protein